MSSGGYGPPPGAYGPPPGGGYGPPPGGGYVAAPQPAPAAPTPKKSNTTLYILLAIVGGVVLLGGGCVVCLFAGGGMAWYNARRAAATGGPTCERAVDCCRTVMSRSGSGTANCENYRRMPESSCSQALGTFESAARNLGTTCGASGIGAGAKPAPALAKPGQSCQNPWDCPGLVCCAIGTGGRKCTTRADCAPLGWVVCTQNIHCGKDGVCSAGVCGVKPQ